MRGASTDAVYEFPVPEKEVADYGQVETEMRI
jgi:hypothetical protein